MSIIDDLLQFETSLKQGEVIATVNPKQSLLQKLRITKPYSSRQYKAHKTKAGFYIVLPHRMDHTPLDSDFYFSMMSDIHPSMEPLDRPLPDGFNLTTSMGQNGTLEVSHSRTAGKGNRIRFTLRYRIEQQRIRKVNLAYQLEKDSDPSSFSIEQDHILATLNDNQQRHYTSDGTTDSGPRSNTPQQINYETALKNLIALMQKPFLTITDQMSLENLTYLKGE